MAISKISSSSIDPNVSLGDGFFKIDSTNNRVGIGTSNPNFDLDVSAGSLGTTSGDSLSAFRLHSTTGNNDYLNFSKIRESDGIYWDTAVWRIQQKVDVTDMGYIQFNGSDNVQGLSFGTANTERMRIDSAGYVTKPYQPAFLAIKGNTETTGTVSSYSVVNTNIGNNFNASTGIFTAPVSGRYVFSCQVVLESGESGSGGIIINGGSSFRMYDYLSSTSRTCCQTMVVNLSANDAVNFSWSSTFYSCFLSGHLIG